MRVFSMLYSACTCERRLQLYGERMHWSAYRYARACSPVKALARVKCVRAYVKCRELMYAHVYVYACGQARMSAHWCVHALANL
eukprot:6206044-Pleurochrysis_carterae.AAC.3